MIIRYSGGLGNQMFQYAFGRAAQIKNGCSVSYDKFAYIRDKKRNYELNRFNIVNDKGIGIIKTLIYNYLYYTKNSSERLFVSEKDVFIKQELSEDDLYKYFIGHWQNLSYFDAILDELRNEFTLKDVPESIKDTLSDIMNEPSSVAVHVRRGDYLNIDGYVVQSKDYYENAIEVINKQLSKPVFYVFSDDIRWCKENLFSQAYNMRFVDGNNTCEDFTLMRACKNHIVSNSTFSWWAAILTEEGIKIAPLRWFEDDKSNIDVRKALLENIFIMK